MTPLFQHILVGLDGSEAGQHALREALRLAALTGGHVHALSVKESHAAYAGTVGEADEEDRFVDHYFRRVHAEARRVADGKQVPITFEIVSGHAADRIVERAREGNFDLVVLGHTGHSRLRHFLLGSTADRVTEHAPCPVLVVR